MAEGFKILDAYVEVRADAGKVADDVERQVRNQQGKFSSVGGGMGSALVGGLSGVVGGAIGGVVAAFTQPLAQGVNQALDAVFTTAKAAVIDYNQLLENANIGFTTLLGSADKAKSYLADLQKFARETPFEFGDLTQYAQRLVAMGVASKDVVPYLRSIGDAAAGLGIGKEGIDRITLAIGQMLTRGRVQGQEVMQLNEAGINVNKLLADSYGVTTQKIQDMEQKGQILAKVAVPVLIRALEQGTKTTAGFGGMMDKQSHTMAGALSNIQDSINQTLSTAFLPMFKLIERITLQISKFATSKGVQKWAADTARSVGGFLDKVGKAFNDVFNDPAVQASLQALGKAFNETFAKGGVAVNKILPNLVSFGQKVLPQIIRVVTKIVEIMPLMFDYWVRFSKILSGIATPVGVAVHAFGDLTKIAFLLAGAIERTTTDMILFLQQLPGFLAGQKAAQDARNGKWGGGAGDFSEINKFRGSTIASENSGAAVASAFKSAKGSTLNIADLMGGGSGGDSKSGGSGGKKEKTLAEIFKVFKQYGKNVAAGIKSGLLGSVDQVKAAGIKMTDAVKEAFTAGKISKGRENQLLKEIDRVTSQLAKKAEQRTAVAKKLTEAQTKLSDLQKERQSLAKTFQDSYLGKGEIQDLFGTATLTKAASTTLDGRKYDPSYSAETAPAGLAGVKQKLQKLVTDTKNFRTNLRKLVDAGVDKYTVQQLLDAGPTIGLPISSALLADPDAMRDISNLQNDFGKETNDLAVFGSHYEFDDQIAAAQDKVDRLRGQSDRIVVNMIVEASKIDEVGKVVRAVKALPGAAKAKKAVRR